MNTDQILVVKAAYSSLEAISDFIQSHAEESGLSFKKTWEVMLALDELCCNIISHSDADDDEEEDAEELRILWKQDPKGVAIQISDDGPPYNPMQVTPGERDVLEENRRLGGMGPYLIEKMLDEVTYKRVNGTNVLTLRKKKRKS